MSDTRRNTTLDGHPRCADRYKGIDEFGQLVSLRCPEEAQLRVLIEGDEDSYSWAPFCFGSCPDRKQTEELQIEELLTSEVNVYTNKMCMGRPPKPESERRSKLFLLRLTVGEIAELEAAARRLGVSVADIFRRGARLYIERSKDGSKRKEKKN